MPWVLTALGAAYLISRLRGGGLFGGRAGAGEAAGFGAGGGVGAPEDEGGGGEGDTLDLLGGGVYALPDPTGGSPTRTAALSSAPVDAVGMGGRTRMPRRRTGETVDVRTAPDETRRQKTSVGIATPSFGASTAPSGGRYVPKSDLTGLAPGADIRGLRQLERQGGYVTVSDQGNVVIHGPGGKIVRPSGKRFGRNVLADYLGVSPSDVSDYGPPARNTRNERRTARGSAAQTTQEHAGRAAAAANYQSTPHDSTRANDHSNRRQADRRTVSAGQAQATSVQQRLGL